ncbi:hypothetical protein [Mycobacteroides abscessus]|uniref:hypothetical protein n=1 Tax=Mycobacteroides abscessus TaxID=36809 RepID=UPI000A61546B|nr:hypothetical protein [Mycobacteroides abscessus]
MAVMTTAFFYVITAYRTTFGNEVLALVSAEGLLVPVCVCITNFTLLPLVGALSDRIGHKPLLAASSVLGVLVTYPPDELASQRTSLQRLPLTVQLVPVIIYASYTSAFIVHSTEIVSSHVRTPRL